MKTLKLQIKNVYGNDLIYPVCDQSKLFAQLLNKKTFSHMDLCLIERLGYLITY
jgi:hypothetical protein